MASGQQILEALCCLNYFAMFYIYGPTAILCFLGMLFSPTLFFVPCFYFAWCFYDKKTPFQEGRRSTWARNSFIWRYMAKYFPITLHKTAELDPSKNYVIVHHPHALFAVSNFVNFATEGTGVSQMFPGITVHPLTLNVNFWVPGIREWLLANGLGAVSSESIEYKLTKLEKGQALSIVVGGAAEAELADPNEPYCIKLKDRKGFVKLALKTGTSMIPMFSFGETSIFYVLKPKPGTFIYKVRNFLYRTFHFVPVIPYGRSYFWPLRNPIHAVVGAPIDVPLIPHPSPEEVDEYHALYVEALTKLFDENVKLYGDPSKKLLIF